MSSGRHSNNYRLILESQTFDAGHFGQVRIGDQLEFAVECRCRRFPLPDDGSIPALGLYPHIKVQDARLIGCRTLVNYGRRAETEDILRDPPLSASEVLYDADYYVSTAGLETNGPSADESWSAQRWRVNGVERIVRRSETRRDYVLLNHIARGPVGTSRPDYVLNCAWLGASDRGAPDPRHL